MRMIERMIGEEVSEVSLRSARGLYTLVHYILCVPQGIPVILGIKLEYAWPALSLVSEIPRCTSLDSHMCLRHGLTRFGYTTELPQNAMHGFILIRI